MAKSLVSELLAERPAEELRELRGRADAALRRLQVEIEQIDEAIQAQAKRANMATRAKRNKMPRGRASNTREAVLGVLEVMKGEPIKPVDIHRSIASGGGPTPSLGSIHNMLGNLVEANVVTRLGEGYYKLASSNGSGGESSSEAHISGLGEHGGQSSLTDDPSLGPPSPEAERA